MMTNGMIPMQRARERILAEPRSQYPLHRYHAKRKVPVQG